MKLFKVTLEDIKGKDVAYVHASSEENARKLIGQDQDFITGIEEILDERIVVWWTHHA
jgi:hypothetical protein